MKLRLLAVGKDKHEPMNQAAAEYVARVAHYYPCELVEVKEEPARASTPVARVRAVEAERLGKAAGEGALLVALDERGKQLSSPELADRLARWAGEGRALVCFAIGGPNGLDPDFVQRAHERWSLSRMTLPHRLARLMLAEQLYRACTIIRGEPYHK